VYDNARLFNATPTRLGIDGRGTEDWRAKDFHSVLDGAAPGGALLARMLALGAARPFAAREPLPASVPLATDRTLSCPAAGEFDRYARDHPQGGMPYGTAPLTSDELRTLATWLERGAPGPATDAAPEPTDVAVWEAFLNGTSLKERIVARYLY